MKKILLLFCVLPLLAACGTLGLTENPSFDQKIVGATILLNGAGNTAADAFEAGKIDLAALKTARAAIVTGQAALKNAESFHAIDDPQAADWLALATKALLDAQIIANGGTP